VTRVLVMRAAGTNCDHETAHAFAAVGGAPETRHVNELLAEPALLRAFRILVFPGGFSYGDDIAAGRVFATELKQRALPEIERFVGDGGLVLGICNGFQVLVKTGLLPGGEGQTVTLTHNDSHRYQDEWVSLHAATDKSFLARGERFLFPIAHAEGKLVASDETLDRLEENGQLVLRYAKNPNGSLRDVAGLCDRTGRILGLMPHPERHLEPWHHPTWTRSGLAAEPDGLRFFRQAVAAVS
jgi:phosphoribosylformylglycinamidine synthase